MSNPNYEQIKRRADAATEGDWQWLKPTGFVGFSAVRARTEHPTNDPESPVRVKMTVIALDLSAADAEFIAQAHTDIPALLADVEEWRKLSEKQLLQIAQVAGERDRLQARIAAALLANQNSGDPATYLKVREALGWSESDNTDIGELTPTWRCMECGNDIKFRENPKLGGAVFQHLVEPDFPHFPVRRPETGAAIHVHRPSTTPIEGEAQ